MKSVFGFITLALSFSLSSCSNGSTSTQSSTQNVENPPHSSKVIFLRDKQAHDMPANIFYGAEGTYKQFVDSLYPSGTIPSNMGFFYVDLGVSVLFDAGLGAKFGGGIDSSMAAIGLHPDSVRTIFVTHCHADHIGGLLNAEGKALFSQAEIWIPKVEYDYWLGKYDQVKEIFDVYPSEKLHFYTYDESLPWGVVAIPTPGHTPGHTAYRFENTLIGGDFMHGVALQKQNMDISCDYDEDKVMAAQARKEIIQLAKDSSLTLWGMHLPNDGLYE